MRRYFSKINPIMVINICPKQIFSPDSNIEPRNMKCAVGVQTKDCVCVLKCAKAKCQLSHKFLSMMGIDI